MSRHHRAYPHPMFRFTIRDVAPLTGAVLVGAFLCGTGNAAVSGDAVETVYQRMRGIAFGGVAGAVVFWLTRAIRTSNT